MKKGFYLTPERWSQIDSLLRRFSGGGSRLPGQNVQAANFDVLPFKCNAACPAWGAMRITGTTLDSDNISRLDTVQPDTTFGVRYLVNLGEDAVSDGGSNYYGEGTYLDFSGHVLCDSTYVPTNGQEWGPTSGSWSLVRHRPGFLIDGGPTGSGATYRAVAKQRIVSSLVGKADGSAVVDTGTFTMSVWMRNAATGTMEDSGYDIASVLAWGAAITSGKKVSALLHGGQWMGAPWQC